LSARDTGGGEAATDSTGSAGVFGDRLPPLAPPVGADEDAQHRVPAVRDLGSVLEVVPAVLALLVAVLRLGLEDRIVGEVTQFDRELLVDLLRFRLGDLVFGESRDITAVIAP